MNTNFKNYYQILGISINANEEEIKKAYRKKARQYHPDKYNSMNISESEQNYYEEKFKEVGEAYEVLSNSRKRREYNIEYNQFYCQTTEEYASRQKYTEHNNFRDNFRNNYEGTTEDSNENQKYTSHKNFAEKLKDAYDKVKTEEKQNSFTKRHRKLNRKIDKNFNSDRDTLGKKVAFNLGSGTIHVFYETFYQLDKLKMIREDNLSKFIVRNRILFVGILCSVIIGNILENFKVDYQNEPHQVNSISNEGTYEADKNTITIENDNISYISLRRKYTVGDGDTLSQLAEDSQTSMDDIKKLNNLESDLLYYKDEIEVPYIINKEDLQYYTMTVPTNGKSIYDLATLYETDVDTLHKLNEEAITDVFDTFIIITDNILVPNFISKQELDDKKENFKNNSW